MFYVCTIRQSLVDLIILKQVENNWMDVMDNCIVHLCSCVFLISLINLQMYVFWQNESQTAKELVKIIEDAENEYQVCWSEESLRVASICEWTGFIVVPFMLHKTQQIYVSQIQNTV